jgi:hypothetical protein
VRQFLSYFGVCVLYLADPRMPRAPHYVVLNFMRPRAAETTPLDEDAIKRSAADVSSAWGGLPSVHTNPLSPEQFPSACYGGYVRKRDPTATHGKVMPTAAACHAPLHMLRAASAAHSFPPGSCEVVRLVTRATFTQPHLIARLGTQCF